MAMDVCVCSGETGATYLMRRRGVPMSVTFSASGEPVRVLVLDAGLVPMLMLDAASGELSDMRGAGECSRCGDAEMEEMGDELAYLVWAFGSDTGPLPCFDDALSLLSSTWHAAVG